MMIEVSSIRVVVTDKDKQKVEMELTLEDAQQLYIQLQKLFAVSPSYAPVVINPVVWPLEPVPITCSGDTQPNYFSAA